MSVHILNTKHEHRCPKCNKTWSHDTFVCPNRSLDTSVITLRVCIHCQEFSPYADGCKPSDYSKDIVEIVDEVVDDIKEEE